MPKRSQRVLSSDRRIQSVRADGERAEFRIAGARNLVLRVSANGTKSWLFLYADPDTGSRRKVQMGHFPEVRLAAARARCLRLNADLAEGRCPRPTPTATLTFATLAEDYLREHAKIARRVGPGSWTAEVRRILNAEVLPAFGSVPADAVTRTMIAGAVERPRAATRLDPLINLICNECYAARADLYGLGKAPCCEQAINARARKSRARHDLPHC